MITPYNKSPPLYSKKAVRRAGEKLREYNELSSNERSEAISVAEYWRQLHMYPLNTFQTTLRNKLSKANIKNQMVAQRLKKMPTMIGKLSRMIGSFESMQDIAGIRIVFQSFKDLNKFKEELLSSKFKHKLKTNKDYISEPKEDGYRGIHLIYRSYSQSKTAPAEVQGLMVEIQLRTRLQHYWATAVEAVDQFYGQSLKFGDGEDDWKEFFLAASAAFAWEEEMQLPLGYIGKYREDIAQELQKIDIDMHAIEKLKAMSIISQRINLSPEDRQSTKTKFYLLMLKKGNVENELSFKYFVFNEKEENDANTWYEMQEKHGVWGDVDVVLVRTTGKQLTKLYSNYFLNVNEFLQTIQKFMGDD